MRTLCLLAVALLPFAAAAARAGDLLTTCHASSSYDITLLPGQLVFTRPGPAPTRVTLADGTLSTDGVPVKLMPEQQDQLSLFEQDARALEPRVKALAVAAVDLAMRAVDAQAASMNLSPTTRAQMDQRLAAHAAALKRRIAASDSTRDWQGQWMQQFGNEVAADIAPLIAADLGQQALDAALNGDLNAAARLRDQATSVVGQWQPRLVARMQALRPQVAALCPSLQQMASLQQGVRDAAGRPLQLLSIGR